MNLGTALLFLALAADWELVGQQSLDEKLRYKNPESVIFHEDKFVAKYDGAVLTSPDGTNWNTYPYFPLLGLPKQATALSFQDKIFYVGGIVENHDLQTHVVSGTYNTKIWSTDDGKSWTNELESVPWTKRIISRAKAFNGYLWVFGGMSKDDDANRTEIFTDTWRSKDGKIWEHVALQFPWGKRIYGDMCVFKGRLWYFGGIDCEKLPNLDGKYEVRSPELMILNPSSDASSSEKMEKDIWVSDDGLDWERLETEIPQPGFYATAANSDYIFAFNISRNKPYTERQSFRTSDCINWEQIPDIAAYCFNTSLSNTAFTFGNRVGLFNKMLYATDNGYEWECLNKNNTLPPNFSSSSPVSFKGKIWCVGARTTIESNSANVWSSINGKNWKSHPVPEFGRTVDFRQIIQVIATKEHLYAAIQSSSKQLWRTKDGNEWTMVEQFDDPAPIWLIESKGILWDVGYFRYPKHRRPDNVLPIKYSNDGSIWKTLKADEPWINEDIKRVFSALGRIWVLTVSTDAESDKASHSNDDTLEYPVGLWSSADGTHWSSAGELPTPLTLREIGYLKFFEFDNYLNLAKGFELGLPNWDSAIWRSRDGVNWDLSQEVAYPIYDGSSESWDFDGMGNYGDLFLPHENCLYHFDYVYKTLKMSCN